MFKNKFDVCISQDSQGLIVKKEIDTDYFVYILQEKVKVFKTISRGTTIQGVTKRQLSELQILLPPLSEQKRIVAKLDALSAERKKLKGIYAQKIVALDELRKSVLQRAFEGEM